MQRPNTGSHIKIFIPRSIQIEGRTPQAFISFTFRLSGIVMFAAGSCECMYVYFFMMLRKKCLHLYLYAYIPYKSSRHDYACCF